LYELNQQSTDLSKKIKDLENTINQFNARGNSNQSTFKQLLIKIESESAKQIKINMTYLVNNAGWSPVYDFQCSSVNEPLLLTQRANIYQDTQIDWTDVKLSLSSSEPYKNTGLPEFQPKYLSYYKPNKEGRLIKPSTTRWERGRPDPNCLSENPEDCMVMALVEVPAERAVIAQTDININVQLKELISLPSSPLPINQLLRKDKVVVKYVHQAISTASNYGYLTAWIEDWEQLDLIEGKANIYSHNTFFGTINLNPKKIDDVFEISLGIDKEIIVEKQKLSVKSKKSIFENNKTEFFSYKTTVKNNKSIPINLLIKEQIPLSNNGEISITLEESNGADYTEDNGLLEKSLNLKPTESKSYTFEYAVKYPKDKYIGY